MLPCTQTCTKIFVQLAYSEDDTLEFVEDMIVESQDDASDDDESV